MQCKCIPLTDTVYTNAVPGPPVDVAGRTYAQCRPCPIPNPPEPCLLTSLNASSLTPINSVTYDRASDFTKPALRSKHYA